MIVFKKFKIIRERERVSVCVRVCVCVCVFVCLCVVSIIFLDRMGNFFFLRI